MATAHFATSVKNSMLTDIKNAIDAGPAAGTIKFYTGSMPATTEDTVTTQTLLGTLTFSDPCGTVTSGTFTASAITDDSSADASGTATWCRVLDSTGVSVIDLDVTNTGGGGAVQLNTVVIVAGGPIRITSFTISIT